MRSRAAISVATVVLVLGLGCSKNNSSGPSGPGNQTGPATLTRLTSGPAFDTDPQWSPDGRTLAYVSDRSGIRTIWLRPDSGEAAPLLESGDNADPQWSPDGGWIAYTAKPAGARTRDIWKVPSTGGAPTQITHDTTDVSTPRWSPDGLRIAYLSHFSGVLDSLSNLRPPDLWIVSADGGEPTQMTDSLDIRSPRWSPDGTRIAFVLDGGSTGIFTIDLTGLGARAHASRPSMATPFRVTGEAVDPASFRWSPDGAKIAFTWLRSGHRLIGVVPSLGGTPEQPISSPDNQAGPEWSPDGSQFAFLSELDGMSELWVASSAGGAGARLTFTDLWDEYEPRWSPDGKKIAYVSQAGGDSDLWLATFK